MVSPVRPGINTMGLCDALVEIVPEVSYLADMDKPLQTIASHVDRCGAIRQVTYSEALKVLPLVPELLAWEQPEAWEAVLPTEETAGVMSPLAPESYLPAPVLDAVEAGGLTAVLDGNRMVHVLDGVGPLVWRSLCEGRDFASLALEVERQFGAPPEQQLKEAVRGGSFNPCGCRVLVRVPAP